MSEGFVVFCMLASWVLGFIAGGAITAFRLGVRDAQSLRDGVARLVDRVPPDSGGEFVYADGFFDGYERAQEHLREVLSTSGEDNAQSPSS